MVKNPARLATALALVAIAVATLLPSAPPAIPLPMFCLVCGDLGGVDVVLNVVLFIPLGAALAASGGGWRRSIAVAAAVSLTVELLQFSLVPGRDASLSDLLTNSLGGLLGAALVTRPDALLAPRPAAARVLSLAAAALALGVMSFTAAVLRPTMPPMGLWGQWTPQQLHFEPYGGRVRDFRIDDIPVPYNLVPEWARLRGEILDGETVGRVEFVSGPPPRRLAAIARVGSRFQEVALFGAVGDAFVYRTRLAVRDWRLRTPLIAVPGALANGGEQVVAEAGLHRRGWFATVTTPRGTFRTRIPFSIALGWTFFLPLDVPLTEGRVWLSALWLAAITLPAAFWGAVAGRSMQRTSWRYVWWGASLVACAAGLLLIQRVAQFESASLMEWLGVALGGAGGAMAERWLRPRIETSPGH